MKAVWEQMEKTETFSERKPEKDYHHTWKSWIAREIGPSSCPLESSSLEALKIGYCEHSLCLCLCNDERCEDLSRKEIHFKLKPFTCREQLILSEVRKLLLKCRWQVRTEEITCKSSWGKNLLDTLTKVQILQKYSNWNRSYFPN